MNMLKYRIHMLLMSVLLMFVTLPYVNAQDDRAQIKDLLLKMQRAYRDASYLDFRMSYYYANQNLPDKPLDSLLGRVQMDKNRCRLLIDNTETLVTEKYTIQVMRQDKAIYMSKSRRPGLIDPVGVLDSALAHMSGIKSTISRKEGLASLTLRFPPGQQYTEVSMMIDEKSGFIQRVTYHLHAATLVSQDMIDRPEHPGPYQPEGQVDVFFTGYRSGSFGETVFDESRFVKKVEDRFEPSDRFKDFHIFLASTNL